MPEQYHFEDFTMKSVQVPDAPMVSIQKLGTFALNRSARELLGDSELQLHVKLRYDRDLKTIGMTVVDASIPYAYPVRMQKSHGATWIVAGAAFCKHHNIPIGRSRRYRVHAINGSDGLTLIIDLRSEERPKRAAPSTRGRSHGGRSPA